MRLSAQLMTLSTALALTLSCLTSTSDAGRDTDRQTTRVQLVSAGAMTSRTTAFSRAWSKRGGWYRYGGNGPRNYDCSGLVYYAYRAKLPRTSGAQRASAKTVHVSRWRAKRGDLAFTGHGHVVFVYDFNKNRTKMRTYGARHTGTRIDVSAWHPVRHIEHVRGAG